MKTYPPVLCATFAAVLLTSCTAIKNGTASLKERTGAATAKLPDLVETPIARLLPAGGLKVVEVREKDLKPMPSGQEKALAYRNERRNAFWFLGGPVDFQEPALPEPGTELDGSLLPPKMP